MAGCNMSLGNVHMRSGTIIIGDPLFERKSKLLYVLNNVYIGRWVAKLCFLTHKRVVILERESLSAQEHLGMIFEAEVLVFSGYVGIFDEGHFQGGNEGCCSSWVEYCKRMVASPNQARVITCGIVIQYIGERGNCKCNGYRDSQGKVSKIELAFDL